jgi:hypothetical protein
MGAFGGRQASSMSTIEAQQFPFFIVQKSFTSDPRLLSSDPIFTRRSNSERPKASLPASDLALHCHPRKDPGMNHFSQGTNNSCCNIMTHLSLCTGGGE